MSQPLGGDLDVINQTQAGTFNTDLDTINSAQDRTRAALAMSLSGAPYDLIADRLGYTTGRHARTAVERALGDLADDPEARNIMRAKMDARLERLLLSVWTRALNPKDPDHLLYTKAALNILERKAKLHGTDTPTQVHVYTPDNNEINQLIANAVELARREEAGEADIIDVEVLSDSEEE